ncbi:MAG: ATP-binding protein [Anaerolineae bacterium]|nr:ATP-binding protein [Anaerolineae bacterium]
MAHRQRFRVTVCRCFWGCLLGTLVLLATLLAPSAAYTASRTVRVGVYQNAPKIFLDENGRAAGLFVELLERIAAEEGWTLVYVPCEWAACLQALADGVIDLMPDVAYSAERDEIYDFHQTPVLESWSRVYASPSSPIREIADLDGKRIAVLRRSIQQTVFAQLMEGFGYQVTLIPTDSPAQAFELAAKGQADGAIASHLFGDYFYRQYGLVKTSFDFSPSQLFYATAAGRNADLLEAIDRHLAEWIPNPGSPYYTTLGHWTEVESRYRVPPSIFWGLGGVTALLIAAIGTAVVFRHQVKLRTKRLEQINEELHQSEQRYQTLARISPVGIFRTDADGATTYVNPKWCEIAGISAEEALGDGWLKAVHPDDREALRQGWQEASRLRRPSFADYRFMRADGTVVWVMGQAVPEVNSDGQVVGYVGTITDITERKQAEDEVRRLNAELEERVAQRTKELSVAMHRAQEADRLKSAFLATMSHELRTPLNSIIGFTGVLLQELAGPLNPEQRKQLGMVRDSARHLLALINDVLDISKIEAGQLEVERAPFDIRAAIESALRSVSPQAQKKGLTLTAAIASNVGSVVSDRRRVEQILLNLLSNAIKFTERGEVRLECRVQNGWLEISVHDTGIGIRPEDLGRLFEPFRQLETGLNRRHEGTGLGLAICKNLVTLLGGQIRVESEWGKGSTFTFTLPIGDW